MSLGFHLNSLFPLQNTETGTDLSGLYGDLFNCFEIIICMQKTLEQKALYM